MKSESKKTAPPQAARFLTPRLLLKRITDKDVGDVFASMNYRKTAEIISFLSWPMTMDQAQALVNKAVDGWYKGNEFIYLAYAQDGGELIGYADCLVNADGQAEIGYWVREPQQGRGYASEMAAGLIDLAFNVLGLESVYATAAYGNEASARVLVKNGLHHVGEKPLILADGSSKPFRLYRRHNKKAP